MAKTLAIRKPKAVITKRTPEKSVEDMKIFNNNLDLLVRLQREIKDLQTTLAQADEYIREEGLNEYVKMVSETGIHSSFTFVSEKGSEAMVIVQDRYKSINAENAQRLKGKYGEDIIVEDTTNSINYRLIQENIDLIKDVLQKSKRVPKELKQDLIVSSTNYSIRKGFITTASEFSAEHNVRLSQVIAEVEPVLQLKIN